MSEILGQPGAEILGTIAEEWVEDGRREGLEKGVRSGIQVVLKLRFPKSHQPLTDRLDTVHSADRFAELLNLSRTAQSIDELLAFLDKQ